MLSFDYVQAQIFLCNIVNTLIFFTSKQKLFDIDHLAKLPISKIFITLNEQTKVRLLFM